MEKSLNFILGFLYEPCLPDSLVIPTWLYPSMPYVSIFDELSHVSEKPMTEKSQFILLIYDIKDVKLAGILRILE